MQGEAPEEDDEDDEEEEIDLESMTQMNMDSGGVRDFSPLLGAANKATRAEASPVAPSRVSRAEMRRTKPQLTEPSRDEPSWAGRLYTP